VFPPVKRFNQEIFKKPGVETPGVIAHEKPNRVPLSKERCQKKAY